MLSGTKYIQEILTLIGRDIYKLPWMILLFFGVSLLDLVGLSLIAPYIGLVINPDSMFEGRFGQILMFFDSKTNADIVLKWLSVILVALFMAKAFAAIGIHHLIILFSQNQQVRLRSHLMQSYQELSYKIFLQRNSAEYIHSVEVLTGQFQNVIQQLLKTISDFLVILLIFGLLVFESPLALSLLVFLVGSMLLLYDRFFRNKMKTYGFRQNQASQLMVRAIHEGLEGLKEIRILGKEEYFYNAVKLGAKGFSFNQCRFLLVQSAPRYLIEAILVFFVVILVLTALNFKTPTESLLGTLGLFGMAAIRLLPMVTMFAANITNLRFYRNSINRLYTDIKDLSSNAIKKEPFELSGKPYESLKMKNVVYTYPDSKLPALIDICLEIQVGESIGLIGPSGSGKTTMVDVLLGLLEPQSGTMLFNGKPLLKHLSEWRSQVAYLPQQVFLIDNTLRCNIALGEEECEINEFRLKESLRQARLEDLIDNLPKGLDTILGERGVRLSGGQRQRVALARAFYHGRSVLVMDEATSALDNDTEQEIVDEIQRLKGYKTMIVIAHRYSTIKYCDRIYRLGNGKILEVGTPREILSKAS